MRARTSAVLVLVATLLASHASGFACLLDCGEPAPAVTAARETEAAEPAEGSCHRELEPVPASDAALTAAPHDCDAHVDEGSVLATRRAFDGLVPLSRHDAVFEPSVLAFRSRAFDGRAARHDLAPPGPGPRLITALRI